MFRKKVKKICAVVVTSMMVLSMAACGSDESDSSVASEVGAEEEVVEEVVEDEQEDAEAADTTESDTEDSDSATQTDASQDETAQPVPVTKEINETITDDELGYTITIKQAMFNLPFDEDKQDIWYNGYRTGICVEVELTNNSEYTGYLYDHNLSLLVNDQEISTNSGTMQTFQTFADENNLTACPTEGAEAGETISGWLFYVYETGDGNNELVMRYSREETNILVVGTGEDSGNTSTLPAMEKDVILPEF